MVLLPQAARAASDAELAQCSAAFTAGPDLVKQGKLLAAKVELTRCAADPCPTSMRALCADDLRRLEERIPTVVFVAKNAAGEDVTDVRVSEAGRTVTQSLDGRSIPVDPGTHTFRFQSGGRSIDVSVVVHEGERARPINARFVSPAAASRPSPTRRIVETRPVTWPIWVTAGVGVVATASFGYFGTRGLMQRSELDDCKGSCDAESVDRARTHFTIADASLVTAAVAFGVSAVLYLARPTERRELTSGAFVLPSF
jgi:hypothetical protein